MYENSTKINSEETISRIKVHFVRHINCMSEIEAVFMTR